MTRGNVEQRTGLGAYFCVSPQHGVRVEAKLLQLLAAQTLEHICHNIVRDSVWLPRGFGPRTQPHSYSLGLQIKVAELICVRRLRKRSAAAACHRKLPERFWSSIGLKDNRRSLGMIEAS